MTSNYSRRDFLKVIGLASGLILAAPSLDGLVRSTVAESKSAKSNSKYTHVANEYPWEKVAITRDEIWDLPASKKRVRIINPKQWKEIYFGHNNIRALFREAKKMDKILEKLTDGNLDNDELSWVNITDEDISYRIVTRDNSFAQLLSKAPDDIKNYGTVFLYVASIRPKSGTKVMEQLTF